MKKISLFVACCLCFVGCKKAQGTQGVSTECGTSCDTSQVADSIHYMNSKEYRASGKAPRIDYAPIEAASNLVKPFYCSEREHSFVLDKSQCVKAGKSRDAIIRWYRDEKEWEVQDSTYSKIEILQDDSLLAGYINDNGWVKLSEYPMNDSVTVLLLEERTYSAGSPSLCLLKLENRSVSVLYNQEQFINHIAEKAGSLELTLFGFVHDYRHYKLNASHPILMGPHVKMNIDRNGIKLFDSEGHETSISLQHKN